MTHPGSVTRASGGGGPCVPSRSQSGGDRPGNATIIYACTPVTLFTALAGPVFRQRPVTMSATTARLTASHGAARFETVHHKMVHHETVPDEATRTVRQLVPRVQCPSPEIQAPR